MTPFLAARRKVWQENTHAVMCMPVVPVTRDTRATARYYRSCGTLKVRVFVGGLVVDHWTITRP